VRSFSMIKVVKFGASYQKMLFKSSETPISIG